MSVDAHILCGWGSVFRLDCMCELLQASAGVFKKWAAFCQESLREKTFDTIDRMLQRKPSNVSDKSRNKPKVKFFFSKIKQFVHLLWWNDTLRKYKQFARLTVYYSVLTLSVCKQKPCEIVTLLAIGDLFCDHKTGVKVKTQSRLFTAAVHH